MGVRPGYKQTEVGVIPEDWAVIEIRSVCKLINGRGFKPYEWQRNGLPIIRIQNLNGSEEFNYFQGSYDKKLKIEPGQLLFAWSGSRGTSFGPHIWQGPLGLLNYHTWKVQVHNTEIDTNFFYYALKKLTTFIEDKAHGASALVHTQKWEMECFELPVPPTKTEQRAIAAALSDMDALIASLDRLIAKKRDMKQAAMQELLTGKRRLPGFSGDWEEKRLGDLCEKITTGKLDANAMVPDGEYPFFTCARERYAIDTFAFDAEALLVSGNGANVGYIHYYKGKFNAYQRTYVLTGFNATIQYIKRYMERNLQDRLRSEVNAGNTPYIVMSTLNP